MKKQATFLVCAGSLFLVGCSNSGTTYGTGTSHEEATLKSMYNLLSIKPQEKANIDYSARPELVMPANKQALPSPDSAIEQSDGQAWPVSPEQKIAAVREGVPEPDEYGNLPTEYLTSKKEGIRNSAGLYRSSRANAKAGGGEQFLDEIRKEAVEGAVSDEVARRREQLSYSTGVQRKYLTEPPSEYRQPVATADAGDLGITKEEITAEEKAAAVDKRNTDHGTITPGG